MGLFGKAVPKTAGTLMCMKLKISEFVAAL